MTTGLAEETIRTTCPRDCYDACGIHVVKRKGVILKVMGDPDHPHNRGTLCGKCTLAYNGAWRDPEARLLHPLKRVGPKGAGEFVRVSWEDALTTIAGRLTDVLATSGGASVVQTHYTGTFAQIGFGFPLRFFHKIGATEVDPDTVCNKAGHVALGMTFGSSLDGFDPTLPPRRRLRSRVGGQPVGVRAPRPPPLAAGSARQSHRRGPDPPPDGGAGGPALAAVPRHRRRAGLCAAPRDRAGGPAGSAVPGRADGRLGRSRTQPGRLHPRVGRRNDRRPGGT